MRGSVAALAAVAALLSGCTSGAARPVGSSGTTTTRTQTLTRTPSVDVSPIGTGPTTSAVGTCPLLDEQTAAGNVGMRLAKVTVSRSGGKVVGCDFFALQGSPYSHSEHLPGPNQPAVRLQSSRYADATAAHNAMVLLADHNHNGQPAQIAAGLTGVLYQTEFDPTDHGQDWACAFSKGDTLVVVTTAVTKSSLNAVAVAGAVAGSF
ncbi:MAG: hypothetical protein ACR2LF_05665 [Jatrophihabitantaceae bacterium]